MVHSQRSQFFKDNGRKLIARFRDTSGLISGTGVAIVSLGSARDITFRNIADKSIQNSFSLLSGSLLYVDDAVQALWIHAIRNQANAGPSISLTWRAFRP